MVGGGPASDGGPVRADGPGSVASSRPGLAATGTAGAGSGRPVTVLRGLLVAAGLAVAGYGLHGLFTHTRATHPPQAARWLVGGVLAHDLIAFPLTAVVGLLLSRFVRAPYRAVAQGTLIVSAAVALATLPLWRGYGGSPDNATVNPLPYGRNLAIVLGAVWAVAAALIVIRATRPRWRAALAPRPAPDSHRSARPVTEPEQAPQAGPVAASSPSPPAEPIAASGSPSAGELIAEPDLSAGAEVVAGADPPPSRPATDSAAPRPTGADPRTVGTAELDTESDPSPPAAPIAESDPI